MTATRNITLGRYETNRGTATIKGTHCGNEFSITLNLNRPSERYIYECHAAGGVYEGETLRRILNALKPGDTFFDVGAHVGYFTAIMLAAAGPSGGGICFEPDEDNSLALRINFGGIIIKACVGRTAGQSRFFKNLDNDGGNALWNPSRHPFNVDTRRQHLPPEMKPMVRLDDFAIYRPTVIKIDTEGAEVEVLTGASTILAQPQLRLVVAELNHHGLAQMGANGQAILDIMERHGFVCETENADGVGNLFFTRP